MAKHLFKKGRSGNPGGRPKGAVRFSELARSYSPRALQVLVEALESKIEKNRITAASMILDRAYGKPKQEVEGMDIKNVVVMGEVKKSDGKVQTELRYNIGSPDTSEAA